MEIKVYYEDTDCGRVVYYATYLRWFERARTEHLEGRGVSLVEYQKNGIVFTVVNANIDYLAPAVYGDILLVKTDIDGIKASSFTVHYSITRKSDKKLIVIGTTRMACVNEKIKPVRLPDEIREAL